MKRRLRGLALAAACVLFAGACSSAGSSSSSSGPKGTLTISNENGQLWTCGFNPFNLADIMFSLGPIYEPLAFVNALQNAKTSPWLATAWGWSNNNKTLTFTIRDGVKWNDGQPMTAADVVYTFQLLKQHSALDLNSLWSVLSSVTQSGSNQVVMNFKNPAVPYFFYIADQVGIVPQHIWSTIKDPVNFQDAHPVATGAYTMSCTPQNQVYTANKNYWQKGLPKVAKVLYPAFTSNDPANTYLSTGQAQWGSQFIPNIDSFYAKKSPNHHYWFPPVANVTLFPNLKKAPLSDVAVRQAISYAIDRNKATQTGEYGYEPASNQGGVVTPTFSSWLDQASAGQYTYNPAKAEQVLQAAGYKKGSDGIYASPSGQKLSFHIIVQGGFSDWIATLQVVAQQLKAAGIQVTVDSLSTDAFQTRLYRGQFDLAYYAETDTGPSPYYEMREWLYSKNTAPIGQLATTNFERYSDPATDKLFDSYGATTDTNQQHQFISQVQQVMVQKVPVIPVTEEVDWYQYDTGTFTGWVTKENPFAQPAAYAYPDLGVMLLHLQPK